MFYYELQCTCPLWENSDDFDGPEDYARACGDCPAHGLES